MLHIGWRWLSTCMSIILQKFAEENNSPLSMKRQFRNRFRVTTHRTEYHKECRNLCVSGDISKPMTATETYKPPPTKHHIQRVRSLSSDIQYFRISNLCEKVAHLAEQCHIHQIRNTTDTHSLSARWRDHLTETRVTRTTPRQPDTDEQR